MNDNREKINLALAIAFSVAILLGWQYFMGKKAPPPSQGEQPQIAQSVSPGGSARPEIPGGAPMAQSAAQTPKLPAQPSRDDALGVSPRLPVSTPSLKGSISLKGSRLDDLTLVNYRETPDPESDQIVLLSPGSNAGAYYAEFGWVASDAKIALPGPDAVWTANAEVLSPGHPVTLSWNNGAGLKFSRVVTVDENYLFSVTQKVENATGQAVTLFPYALVARAGTPQTTDIYILHEGPVGVVDGTLKEKKYKNLKDDDHVIDGKGRGGWIGFTDKYWLTALIPDQATEGNLRMSWRQQDGLDRYQTDWLGEAVTVAPSSTVESTGHLFAGAKVLALLDSYEKSLNVPLFDRAIDFGWFWFLTIPFFYFLRFIHEHIANFGIAIMIFTVVIKGAFFPIANKSYRSMSKMKKLQPELKKLQERFGDDRAKLNQEVMALYKREKANPVSGCLPILIQVPVFFALYKVLYVTIEMRHAPFFGWIHDLSAPDPTTFANLFGLIPWDPPAYLHIGVWPLIMGVTMWLQQKLNPAPTDPVQAKMFMFLPFIFTFMLGNFPAGLVIYWAWSNILSIGQQWLIMRSSEKA